MNTTTQSANGARLGSVLKELRKANGWTLADVSERTGFNVATLSKVENGRVSLSYEKLIRLSEGLGVDIAQLFATPKQVQAPIGARRSVNRRGESESLAVRNYLYQFINTDVVNKKFNPCLIEPQVGDLKDFGPLARHEGEELVYVLEGEVEVHTDLYAPLTLRAGDSFYIDSSMGHAYLAKGGKPCRMLGITSESPGEARERLSQESAPAAAAEEPPVRTSRRRSPKKHR